MVFIENETDIDLGINYEEVATRVIERSLEILKCPFQTEINLILTDNAGIHSINKECRNIDRPTDVLSFPNLFFEEEGIYDLESEDMSDYTDPENGLVILGDIIISLEKVKEQAVEYGHSNLREYAFLITHSILHLSGYDHMEPEEASRMEDKQREILNDIGITREL